MPTVKEYKTKQKVLVEEFLKENMQKHLTAEEIAEGLKGKGIGRTTVYRVLDKLVETGAAGRFYSERGQSACFQYLENGKECVHHFHLKCTECGRLIHMQCKKADTIAEHMAAQHGFKVDRSKTVFYGVCDKCSGEINDEKNN